MYGFSRTGGLGDPPIPYIKLGKGIINVSLPKMQMENNWKVMKEENGKQHNGQNMLKESGQFPAQDIPNEER